MPFKTYFRLYSDGQSDLNSTIFDLISGNHETKQTKGLAYVFSQNPEFLRKFLNKSFIINKLGVKQIRTKQLKSIEVNAEKYTQNQLRADIVVKVNMKHTQSFALIIEAKDINANNIKKIDIKKQIDNYLKEGNIPDLEGYYKIGITLTKYKYNISDIISLTWNYILDFISVYCNENHEDIILLKQYKEFLTQINRTMNYYEREVLSIPAGDTYNLVQNYNVYACPNNKNYSYKQSIFVTFREQDSEMTNLYKIEDIIILNPSIQEELRALQNSTLPQGTINRILNYIRNDNRGNNNEEKRFYILSTTEIIPLDHNPRPDRIIQKHTYFTLKDILTKDVVTPENLQ
jgi:hypothetical protein